MATEIKVTGMPVNAGYGNDADPSKRVEHFHPSSRMKAGTWENSSGKNIETIIKYFYRVVYNLNPLEDIPNNKCLYSLYGGKYTSAAGAEYAGKFHPGIDINYAHHAPIYSAHSGFVVDITDYYVTIHTGECHAIYVHLKPNANIMLIQLLHL